MTRLPTSRVSLAGWLFCLGIILFSGSLYIVAGTGLKGFGAVTPLGGVAFLTGWAILGWTAWRQRPRREHGSVGRSLFLFASGRSFAGDRSPSAGVIYKGPFQALTFFERRRLSS